MFKAPTPQYLGPAKFHGAATNKPINRIVIHGTVSPCVPGAATKIAAYFRNTVIRPSSAHYVVGPYGVVQTVYDSVVAYHAPPNTHSLGIELCDTQDNRKPKRWSDYFHRRMLKRAATLTAGLCLAYDIPIQRLTVQDLKDGKRGICGHVDVSLAFRQSTHTDPGPDFPWAKFIGMVIAARDAQLVKSRK